MNEKIKSFIARNQLLALSVLENDEVYSASCYYAFDEECINLIFKSQRESKHIQLALKCPKVGVIIAQDAKKIGLLQGVQIKALFKMASVSQEKLYYQKFPFAKLGEGEVFALEILWAKYTDNKLLLTKKLTFKKGE